jgi:hypothetical protein
VRRRAEAGSLLALLALTTAADAAPSGQGRRVAGGAPSVTKNPYGFDVAVALSPRAAAKLAALGEGIIISASYFGDPAPGAERHADEVGQIDLGREQVEIPGRGGPGVITGRGLRRARLAWLTARGPEVNVNVYSARRSGPDNLLDCDFFQDSLGAARSRVIRLNCKLIGEP